MKRGAVVVGVGGALAHDANAAVLVDGRLVAASQEERFTRVKHEGAFPRQAIEDCLALAGRTVADVDVCVFAGKPVQELIATHSGRASNWLTWQLGRLVPAASFEHLRDARRLMPRASFAYAWHHLCHAAFAFSASPFERAAFLCVDGRGDDVNATIGVAGPQGTEVLYELAYSDGLGMLYSLLTEFLGFGPYCEYKVMGLAPYGTPVLADRLRSFAVTDAEGALRFNHRRHRWEELIDQLARHLGVAPRRPEDDLGPQHLDVAASIQQLFEEEIIRMARFARRATGEERLLFCGGCAQNCVAASRLAGAGIFDDVFTAPAAGDMGIGAGAVLAHHQSIAGHGGVKIDLQGLRLGSFPGPLPADAMAYQVDVDGDVIDTAATLLARGAIVGWVRGRMEYGARALGARSILADARAPAMQATLNERTKFRESFRPFAPAILAEDAGSWFDRPQRSDYMQNVAWLKPERRRTAAGRFADWRERLAEARCDVPAVVHVDFSSRLQTVDGTNHPDLHRLLTRFKAVAGVPMLINTSFNLAGEPIVRTATDAWRCFTRTKMDYLVVDDILLRHPHPEGRP
jgi:carbamoyltransferase